MVLTGDIVSVKFIMSVFMYKSTNFFDTPHTVHAIVHFVCLFW